MKKIIRGINTLIILVAAAATMYGQINLSGKKIHELPALPSNVIDTNYLFIIANPIDGKPYKFKKNLLLSGATGVVDGNYGDVTVSGVTWSINASSVQNSKMAAMANNTFKGNLSGSTAVPQDLTVGQMQSSLGINTKLNATDTASLSNRINSKMTAADTAYLSNRINNKQDLDADLTSISGASGTNTIYYRSAANTWSPVTIGGNMTFSGGTLNSTASGGGTWGSITGTIGNQTDLAYELSQKQAQLVSSSNIKTINNISILGSGNISVGGGGSQTLDQTLAVGNSTDTSILMTSQNSQLIIGDDTAHTFYDGADLYPLLSLEKTGTSIDYYSPMLNFKSNALSGIVWQFNPSGIGVASGQGAPYTFMFGTAKDLQYSGIDNYSYSQGLNYNASGGRVDTNQPQFGNTVEWQYEVSGYGWVVENYTTMTAKNGSSIRPLYQIFNRDSLHKSETVLSSDVIRLQGGKYVDIQGAVNFGFGSVGNSGTIMTLSPGTGSGMSGVYIDMTGTENFSNKLRMKRTTGITGSGTMDDILQYSYDGDKPMLFFGPYVYNAVNGFGSGRLDLAPDGLNRPAIYSSYWRTVNIGAYTALNGYQKLGTLQINYGSGTFAEINTGIDQYSALRLHNTANSIDWSFGADANKFFLNNSTDDRRVFNIDNDGAVSIGNGTTSANASAILDVTSTTKGVLITRMTKTQRNAISSPAPGLQVIVTGETGGEYLSIYNADQTRWEKVNTTAD